MTKLHVHVWDAQREQDNPITETEWELTGEYDDHYQFGGDLEVDGTHVWVELRLWKSDLVATIK